MIYYFKCAVTRTDKYQILLKDSTWFKNLYGNAWFSLSHDDAEYQLNLLRKKGLV